ncbi:LysR substrate-binding domain-containing protein [Pseudoalteromonas sp. ESRF-bin5]|uniref:LysR substrate-binding domain-containing protein n=2 Tax=unclassified Pseudoalteromonas TaxID=194690 RepID=UPI002580D45B|nr:LysR substrate-binding domain-containing protein [Pseudoalteromonas sp. ESRF-bin5]
MAKYQTDCCKFSLERSADPNNVLLFNGLLAMQFQQLNAFKAVYELGTVTAAADYIHITQPAVSRLLSSLEHNIGFKLFQRVKGRLLPTDKGKAFYIEVSKAYSALESLSESAADIKNSSYGSLYIAAFPMLSSNFLPKLLGKFLSSRHNLHSSLKTYRSEEVLRRTALQSCDIGFALLPEITTGVTSIKVECDCVCILPHNSPLAALESISPHDLEGYAMISCEKDHTQRQVDKVFKKAKVKRNDVAEVSLAIAIASLVSEGVGSAIVDPFSAKYSSDTGTGIITKKFTPAIPFRFFILLPALRAKSEIIDQFIELFFQEANSAGIELRRTR